MKRILWIVVIVAVVGAGAFAQVHKRTIQVHDLTWKVDRQGVAYEIDIENLTGAPVTVFGTMVAESVYDGEDGLKVQRLGSDEVEVSLRPNEKKKVSGQIPTVRPGGAATVVSQHLDVRPEK